MKWVWMRWRSECEIQDGFKSKEVGTEHWAAKKGSKEGQQGRADKGNREGRPRSDSQVPCTYLKRLMDAPTQHSGRRGLDAPQRAQGRP